MLERDTIRARKQRQRLPGRRYYSAEQGFSGSQTEEDTIAQSATNQSPKKQSSVQQSGYSGKSTVPDADFVCFREHVATEGGTKQLAVGRETMPPSSSSGIALAQNGQGNRICEPSSPATADLLHAAESLEFGSLGPFSLGLVSTSTQFEEAFPALPTRKRAEGAENH